MATQYQEGTATKISIYLKISAFLKELHDKHSKVYTNKTLVKALHEFIPMIVELL